MTETGIILPDGVEPYPTVGPLGPGNVVIDNRTDLPDEMVEAGVKDYFVENASMAWGHNSTFQTYANNGGSLMARTKFRVPSSIFGEMELAREIADQDDDVRSTIGQMIATAYCDGMQNFHEDERTVGLFNKIDQNAKLDHWLKEIYREYLISQNVTTVNVFVRSRMSFTPSGTKQMVEERLAAPLVSVLHAENVRVVDSDMFGQGSLAYIPDNEKLRIWLEEFFGEETTEARKAKMARDDPVAATLFTRRVRIAERDSLLAEGMWVYALNPRMAFRFTAPKGQRTYARPLLTANFALIEAKRLLNIMDFALLQGGANFIVVAKKGTDQHKASEPELQALGETVRRASRTGVIVGDHRLSFEIITPKLDELLQQEKRSLLGRKLSQTLLRVPEPTHDAGTEGQKSYVGMVGRVVTSDRNDVKRHIEATTYEETATRNSRLFKAGAPKIWHAKIILQDDHFFTDYVLKLRDRGDIPRKFAVEAAGFDWEAGVAQRKLEKADDKVMLPAAVPHDSPNGAPNDNSNGRPPGTSPNNGAPGARPGPGPDPAAPRRLTRGSGEPVRAWWDEVAEQTVRAGEVTFRLLEQYPDRQDGRITDFERSALEKGEAVTEGPNTIIPVNPGHEVSSTKMLRLAPGLSVIVGWRVEDEAVVAKALCFRSPEFTELAAQELVLSLGWNRELEPPEE